LAENPYIGPRPSLARRLGAALRPVRLDVPLGRLYDQAPGWSELRAPGTYLRIARLWKTLRREGYTMIGSRRARSLERLASTCEREGIPGAIVDCGTFNGGSATLMSTGAPTREVWGFDSFEGLPPAGEHDPEHAADWEGTLKASEAKVREAFERFASPDRLHVVKGWFEDTFPETEARIDRVAMLHADGDWYDSVLLTLETFYPKLSPGGFVVIDDYSGWEGAKIATDEYRVTNGIDAPLVEVDSTAVYWQKPR
jgi:O-methyltransferase